MNMSGNATEAINYHNQILKMIEVYNFLSMPVVASSIFGNVIIIVVFAREKVTTTGILFGILAVADMLATFIGPLLKIIAGFSITARAYLGGSFVVSTYLEFIGETITALSTWTLVTITTERFLSIAMPFNVKQLVTVPRVILAETATCISVVVIQYMRHFLAVEFVKRQGMWGPAHRSDTWLKFDFISDWVCFTVIPYIFIITASLTI
ncbi:hypothetical protein DPMN_091351 [Dreissena polymorpha]|uniref:G-protein coupled receptors family 1 profile domain-containing protein n=1 Tax=Dreissena polymorpha TaxID=45954 RepID=A0A9D4L1X3_DREPO|nr:hypothetical protein DPMN_091351 [Dreissena polymorpha]